MTRGGTYRAVQFWGAISIYLALGVNLEGHKELLGLWISENEGAKFWLNVLTELQNRGVKDILIACIDGLKGFPEAIVRNLLKYVPANSTSKCDTSPTQPEPILERRPQAA